MSARNRGAKAFGLAIFTAIAIASFLVLVVKAGVEMPLSGERYEVRVQVPNAATLVSNADVRAAGIVIGHVTKVEPTRSGAADLTVSIDDDHAPLARDTRARVQLKTVLGESYLALNPGTGANGTVENGGLLPRSNIDEQVQLDEILDAFDSATRGRLRKDIVGLGASLNGRGDDLNRALAGLEPTFEEGRPVMTMLARQQEQVARVVTNTNVVLGTLAERKRSLQSLTRSLETTARTAAERDKSIAGIVRTLPATLRNVRIAAGGLERFGDAATPVLTDLTEAAGPLTTSLRALTPAASATRRLLVGLPKLTQRANPLLGRLRTFAKQAPALTREIPSLLCQTNPILDYLAPYHREAGSFFANVGMSNDAGDQLGRNPITVVAGVDANALRMFDGLAPNLVDQLLDATGVEVFKQMQYNPYPKPGSLLSPQPFDGKVPEVKATC